jgi:hypothetical protein
MWYPLHPFMPNQWLWSLSASFSTPLADPNLMKGRRRLLRAEEIAQNHDDPDYWKENRLSFHLGRKLIDLAVRAAQLEGVPVFELNTSRQGGPQTTKTTIALTTTACDWIAEHQPALESLMSPVYRPMIVPPQPMSLSGGGYLVNRLPLLKREPSKRTQRLLKKTDLTPVLSVLGSRFSSGSRWTR